MLVAIVLKKSGSSFRAAASSLRVSKAPGARSIISLTASETAVAIVPLTAVIAAELKSETSAATTVIVLFAVSIVLLVRVWFSEAPMISVTPCAEVSDAWLARFVAILLKKSGSSPIAAAISFSVSRVPGAKSITPATASATAEDISSGVSPTYARAVQAAAPVPILSLPVLIS